MPGRYAICFAAIEDVWNHRGERWLIVDIKSGQSSPNLEKGKFYLLHERYTDFTSRRILQELQKLDETGDNPFTFLLQNPHEALEKRNRPKGARQKNKLEKFLETFHFTESQKQAFIRILDSSHQLIWGPPGTGKPHFLGLSVLTLAALVENEKKKVKVLVTAFTHAAIENCLKMVEKLAKLYHMPLDIVKLGEWKGKDIPSMITVDKSWYPKEENHQVVGCTIFAMAKENTLSFREFDLVVIDEASQLKVAEAAIPISRVSRKSGRLVIAGDDKQLGPIIQGTYPEIQEGEVPLFHSIFESLHHPDRGVNAYTSQLIECFRMNDVLCQFPSQAIYGENFRPANPTIAKARMKVAKTVCLPGYAQEVVETALEIQKIALLPFSLPHSMPSAAVNFWKVWILS